jgi:hypothetical protein
MAQLLYETTDPDFADSAVAALGAAEIPCYRVDHGYGDGGLSAQCIYIERDADYTEANRILVGLGAAVDQPPPAWLVGLIMLVAALSALWIAVGGSG